MKNRAALTLLFQNISSSGRAFIALIMLTLLSPMVSFATHLRAGEITVNRLNCGSLTFRITITAYTNTGSDIKFGLGTLNYGDGNFHTTPADVKATDRPDLGPQIGIVTYSIDHTYAGPGRYVISYNEHNRNGGIANIANSVETQFHIETVINIDPFLGCNNSPRLLVPPIDNACTGAAWYHNPGAYDPDGDSLSFQMVVPKRDKGVLVGNYRDPNSAEFYSGKDYGNSNEDGNGPPIFSIDEVTGTIIWDAPGSRQGEYNIAFQIKEWRKLNGIWVLMGYVVRDMQILVEDCDNKRPELADISDICVEAGEVVTQDIFGYDPDNQEVLIEAFSQVFTLEPSKAAIVFPVPNGYQPSSSGNPARIRFEWTTTCAHIKDQPYQVVFKITDNPPKGTGSKLVQFKTWNITVVGPSPKWVDAEVIPASREASISWEPYACNTATIMEVWRRVDSFPYTPPECVTGMPDFLGFTKIAELPISTTNYFDNNGGKGLAVGAQYCYRLVAVFPSPGGGESYVSEEVCLDPILADAPVITNVSIEKTGLTDGVIDIKWTPPFDIDPVQFPPPYEYALYRAEGISGNLQSVSVFPGTRPDTVFQDTGLNTEELMYNYRVVLYVGGQKIDTSEVASTVRVEPKPLLKKIELTWVADVPWSNRTQDYPLHDIFRGPNGVPDEQMELIATVDVNKNGFTYIDEGTYKNQPLVETQIYCYRITTRGAYGNPKIKEPLVNWSQRVCAQPNDETAPCQPAFEITAKTCEEKFLEDGCGNNVFSNTISWNRPEDLACRNDVRSYNVWIANKIGNEFTLYAENVRDTFFVDVNENLKSYARCYKVQAVDRSGNRSELSEEYCFDNCPHYELPNVFTPGDDGCNMYFSAFSNRVAVDENGQGPCGAVDIERLTSKCARFVLDVNLTVYNRWGKEVYTYQSGGERTIYIDWDGRDSQGSELATGIYYYVANITYDVVDPSQSKKLLKGWVHLIR